MIRAVLLSVLLTLGIFSQDKMPDAEQQHLRKVLAAGSSSAVDLIHALETHLDKFPNSPKKNEIEREIFKSAMQAGDTGRIAKYGQRVAALEPDNPGILEPVCRALVSDGTAGSARTALQLAKRYESLVRQALADIPDSGEKGRQRDELERALGRSILYQAIATGTLGDNKEATELDRKSFAAFPSGETAADLAKRLTLLGQLDAAIRAYADAFSIADNKASDSDRALIRRRMGELYQKLHGSETGLGDLILEAYDRTSALMAARRLALKQFDPNMGLTNAMEYTLTGVDGPKLPLSSLAGKVVVMDFWATWCIPCRGQHPLYEKVKQHFASNPAVLFLSVNTDEDRSGVKSFLEAQGWSKSSAYYEDGLSRALRVSSIPTTVVFAKDGTIATRMDGFDPDSFVEALTARIQSALDQRSTSREGN